MYIESYVSNSSYDKNAGWLCGGKLLNMFERCQELGIDGKKSMKRQACSIPVNIQTNVVFGGSVTLKIDKQFAKVTYRQYALEEEQRMGIPDQVPEL